MKIAFPLLLIALLFTSCSTAGDPDPSEAEHLTLGEQGERFPLKDDLRILDRITQILPLEGGELLIVDDSPALSLFRDHEMVNSIGTQGEGPCEYNFLWAINRNGDSLHVQNFGQSRIITYDLQTGECLGETSHPFLSMPRFMARVDEHYIVGRFNFTMATPDSTTLMYTLTGEDELKELPLKLGSLNPVKTNLLMTMPGLNFVRSGKLLFSYIPFTDVMTVLDLETDSVRQFPLQIDIEREEIELAGADIRRAAESMNSGMQMVYRIFAADEWLAVSIIQQNEGDQDPTDLIQFYSREGTFRGEMELETRPIAAYGDQLLFLHESEDPSSDYIYELSYRPVIVQEEL